MKIMVLVFLLVMISLCAANAEPATPLDQCPDQDVWVYIKHTPHAIGGPPCPAVVYVPERSLEADFKNCPAEDVTTMGKSRSYGFHVVILKKGHLNNIKNYTIIPPAELAVPANNINTWHVEK